MTDNQWLYLSYPLHEDTPAYGGGRGFEGRSDKIMVQGDSCNTADWSLPNHIGTHIDFPRHFSAQGRTLDAYPVEFFLFNSVGFVDLGDVPNKEIITWDHLSQKEVSEDVELLLIKTGFCHKRRESSYWQENPGFSPELADHLRTAFPQLRVIGFDSISLSCFAQRDLGRKAHRAFLDHPRPILPLEDMDLTRLSAGDVVRQVIVAPWQVAGADGAPCTVMGEVFGGN